MNLGELRRFIQETANLPDETEIIVEQKDGGQDEALCVEVCTHEDGGLHCTEEDITDPDQCDELEKPSVKITMR